MFTGIIEGMGTVTGITPSGEGREMAVAADFPLEGTRIGDSIAVNGACLTAVRIDGARFSVDVSPETLAKSTFVKARVGDRVNLERALRLSDRLDGHLVSGHIDGTGAIRSKQPKGNAVIVTVSVPPHLSRYIIRKGSVAVDGVSLTVNDCDAAGFSLSIIPHTAKLTTLILKKPGDAVNIETDMIGKYVERFVTGATQRDPEGSAAIDLSFLAKNGFL